MMFCLRPSHPSTTTGSTSALHFTNVISGKHDDTSVDNNIDASSPDDECSLVHSNPSNQGEVSSLTIIEERPVRRLRVQSPQPAVKPAVTSLTFDPNSNPEPSRNSEMLTAGLPMSRHSYSFNLDIPSPKAERKATPHPLKLQQQLIDELKESTRSWGIINPRVSLPTFTSWKCRAQVSSVERYIDEANEHLAYWKQRNEELDTLSERHEETEGGTEEESVSLRTSPAPQVQSRAQLEMKTQTQQQQQQQDSGVDTPDEELVDKVEEMVRPIPAPRHGLVENREEETGHRRKTSEQTTVEHMLPDQVRGSPDGQRTDTPKLQMKNTTTAAAQRVQEKDKSTLLVEGPGTKAADEFDIWSWTPPAEYILLDAKNRRRPPKIKISTKIKPVISMRKPLKTISLSLDKVPCFAGHVLRGTLNFALRDSTHIKCITLVFEGSSKTSAGNGDSGSKQQWFFHVEVPCLTYLMRVNTLLTGDTKYRLDAGNHEIPFAFPVPPRVPSSFGGKYGYVYYCVKVITAATLGTAEFRTEKAIPLIGIENLNWHSHMRNTINLSKTVTKSGFCSNKVNAHVMLQLRKTGYLPGETISLNAEIENRHKTRRVKRVNFELLQTVYFQVSHDRERVVRNVLAQVAKLDVLPGSMELIEDEPLKIPGCPPSFLRGCDSINIQYDLVVTIEGIVAIRCPLVIGTVPFLGKHLEAQPLDWKAGEASVPYVRMSMAWPWHKPAAALASYFRAQPAFAFDQYAQQDEKPTLKIEEIED